MKALGTGPRRIIVVSAPQRSRGCAEIGQGSRQGRAIVISIAPPSHYNLRRLARLFEHEVGHTGTRHHPGYEHDDMSHDMLWSLGPVPDWAQGTKIKYRRRAPRQM